MAGAPIGSAWDYVFANQGLDPAATALSDVAGSAASSAFDVASLINPVTAAVGAVGLLSMIPGLDDLNPLNDIISTFQGRPKQQATQDIASSANNSDPVIALLGQGASQLDSKGVPISSSNNQASSFGPYFQVASDLENLVRWGTTNPTPQQAALTATTLKNALTELGNPGKAGTKTIQALEQAWKDGLSNLTPQALQQLYGSMSPQEQSIFSSIFGNPNQSSQSSPQSSSSSGTSTQPAQTPPWVGTPQQQLSKGITPNQLVSEGVPLSQLIAAGINPSQLSSSSISNLVKEGNPLSTLLSSGVNPSQLSPKDISLLEQEGNTPAALLKAGVPLSSIGAQNIGTNAINELLNSGQTYQSLESQGVTGQQLINAGISPETGLPIQYRSQDQLFPNNNPNYYRAPQTIQQARAATPILGGQHGAADGRPPSVNPIHSQPGTTNRPPNCPPCPPSGSQGGSNNSGTGNTLNNQNLLEQLEQLISGQQGNTTGNPPGRQMGNQNNSTTGNWLTILNDLLTGNTTTGTPGTGTTNVTGPTPAPLPATAPSNPLKTLQNLANLGSLGALFGNPGGFSYSWTRI